MKEFPKLNAFLSILLLVAVFAAFTSCSSDDGKDEAQADVKVPTSGKSVDELLSEGVKSLQKEEWDEAIAYYNAAYDKENNNTKAIIYSVLANLAKISVDPKVVALFKDHAGFTDYPNRLNALLSDDWLKKYPNYINWCYETPDGRCAWWYDAYETSGVTKDGYYLYNNGSYQLVSDKPQYDSISLPGIKTPNWVKGTGSIYDEALLAGNAFSADNWAYSLLANLLDKNASGLNGLLDDIIDGVFGVSYNTAVERLKKLETKKEERISLDPYFIKQLNLEEVFDEYDKIGWAEVNAVLSAMLLTKASLEWVQSYDLSIDLNWLKYSWKDSESDVMEHFKKAGKNSLPFTSNFLNVRSGKMANSKADFIKAIKGLQDSYTSILTSDLYPSKVKEAYTTINGGFSELISAIENSGTFYIPEDPTEGAWPKADGDGVIGHINLGKLFTEGFFSLNKIFVVDGNKPVFYLDKEQLTLANYSTLIDQGGYLQLRLNTSYIESIIEENGDGFVDEFEYMPIGLHREIAKVVFEKYYK